MKLTRSLRQQWYCTWFKKADARWLSVVEGTCEPRMILQRPRRVTRLEVPLALASVIFQTTYFPHQRHSLCKRWSEVFNQPARRESAFDLVNCVWSTHARVLPRRPQENAPLGT